MSERPILIIDDDLDDKELFEDAWKELPFSNPLMFFKNGEDVINHLKKEPIVPFLIISEFDLPKMNGYELKKKLHEHKSTNFKSIPFVFLTASSSQHNIDKAYNVCTNGYFVKETSFEKLKQQLFNIIKYWLSSKVPIAGPVKG